MRIDILTLFPGMFVGPFDESILKKAQERGLLRVKAHDLRNYTQDKHRTTDDVAYGGGPGMVMKPEPIFKAVASLGSQVARIILMSPAGERLTQEKAKKLAHEEHLLVICGRYEGVDDRIRSLVNDEISVGDYVLTGGELPAMVLVDVVARLIPGVVGERESLVQDSFYNGLLDFPHYTRPSEFKEEKVPEVLTSGNHKQINHWRREKALWKTFFQRPELLSRVELTQVDREILENIFV